MYEAFIRECDRNGCMYKVYHLGVWKRKRRKVIKDFHNECYDCKLKGIITNGTKKHPLEVHHIKPLKLFPHLFLEETYIDEEGNEKRNLIPLCHKCHDIREGRFKENVTKFVNEERW